MILTPKDFIIWLKGFLTAKYPLDDNSPFKKIEEELNKVYVEEFPLNNIPQQLPYNDFNRSNDTGCKFPSNCGMPTSWFGIYPSTCTKCGYTAPHLTTTRKSINNVLPNGYSMDNSNSHHNND